MKIENGKYIYTEFIQYHYYNGTTICPKSVEFTVTTNKRVTINDSLTLQEWFLSIFGNKLLVSSVFNDENSEIFQVKHFFDDFLFVERTDLEYITDMLYNILLRIFENSDQKIESFTYKIIN